MVLESNLNYEKKQQNFHCVTHNQEIICFAIDKMHSSKKNKQIITRK